MTEVIKDGERIFGAYDIIKRFDDVIGAKAYAQENDIELFFH